MMKESKIESILDNLVNRGSNIEYLKELKEETIEITKKDRGLEEILFDISKEIEEETRKFLESKNEHQTNYISGISCGIYLPDFNNNGGYKLKLIGGSRSRDKEIKIDENTMFDVASITKVYTLILLFKLEELGIIDLNSKISDLNLDYKRLEDFTFNDLIRLHGELRTDGNVANASSYEEALERLKTLYLVSNTREENKYTDFGSIVMGKTLEKVISEKLGKQMRFSDIMNEYLLKPLNLSSTSFNPNTDNLTGNGNELGLVHDPKARILAGAVGSAGIFTTSEDLMKLAKNLYAVNYVNNSIINKIHLDRLGEITFPTSRQSNKGNLGIYVKHPEGYDKTYTPPEYSTNSFSHQGWTGSLATFDPNHLIHQNILVNAVYQNEDKEKVINNKPAGFGSVFSEYQKNITRRVMLMYVAKQYLNHYCNDKKDIDEVRFIR